MDKNVYPQHSGFPQVQQWPYDTPVRKRYVGYHPRHHALNNLSSIKKPWVCEAQSVTDLPRLLIGKVLLPPALYRNKQVLTWTWELRACSFVTHSLMVILYQTNLCQASLWTGNIFLVEIPNELDQRAASGVYVWIYWNYFAFSTDGAKNMKNTRYNR